MEHDPTNARVVYRHDLNETLSIVRVAADAGPVPAFTPGQFITLGLPKTLPAGLAETPGFARRPGRVPMVKRAYSIASDAGQTAWLELFVVLIEAGKLTPQLWRQDFPNRVWMDSVCKGEFTLDHIPAGRDLLMISTGTGLAPFLSMLRTYRGQQRWRRFSLVHGVRHLSDLGYREELEQIAHEDPTVRYVPIVSRPAAHEAWPGLRGRIQILLEEDMYRQRADCDLDPEQTHVFLCGNPAMIEETERLLHTRGFVTHTPESAGNIHYERYW